ncbi:ester cyclase [Stenotrophomonas sp. 24(2023)]|uniref:ester cyclase n=1 Tax=Stenotrophomonas sp. 24(2023) TaxID=3068324 RepID=UPI0027E0C164|nr:ester cyclase [Stenotrophomonas sp. 24(2023)]WMJ69223.1 ester cyclase [Stenotrophomonas sp. 24(2023)]
MNTASPSPKQVVQRFNHEVIEQGRLDSFQALMAPDFINWSAPPGAPRDGSGMWITFEDYLRPALSGLQVEIHEQICEGEKVTTRKTIHGRHTGALMGVPATGREVHIDVIDIVTVRDGRYAEHWGMNTLSEVLAQLRSA